VLVGRLLCRLFGHRVGPARFRRYPSDGVPSGVVRVSHCVRCGRPFAGRQPPMADRLGP
jgi:hypothetical protein